MSPLKTFTPGSSQTATASFTNYTGQPFAGVELGFTAPKGWTVTRSALRPSPNVAPGHIATMAFTVAAPPTTGGGRLSAAVSWTNADGLKESATAGDSVRSAHPVKINEVGVAANSFIELYNAGAAPVDVSNWSLSYAASGVAESKIATIPAGTKLPSHGFYVISGQSGRQSFSTTIAPMGSLALMDSTGALVVDSVDWSNSVTSGVVISPLLAEGGCPALMPGGRGAQAPPPITNLSIFRWPDGADTDSNCTDFRVQAATTLPAASVPGATNLKVASIANFGAGQTIRIDAGANLETAVIASVGSPGATTAGAATQIGSTLIPVASAANFGASQIITFDTGADEETLVIVSATGTGRGQGAPAITVATPLKFTHALGAPVSGGGLMLTAPLTKPHAVGAQVTGDVPTPGAPNQYSSPPH